MENIKLVTCVKYIMLPIMVIKIYLNIKFNGGRCIYIYLFLTAVVQ